MQLGIPEVSETFIVRILLHKIDYLTIRGRDITYF